MDFQGGAQVGSAGRRDDDAAQVQSGERARASGWRAGAGSLTGCDVAAVVQRPAHALARVARLVRPAVYSGLADMKRARAEALAAQDKADSVAVTA